jgi:hypothetical protein
MRVASSLQQYFLRGLTMNRSSIASVEQDDTGSWWWRPTSKIAAFGISAHNLGPASPTFDPDHLGTHYDDDQPMRVAIVRLNRAARQAAKADRIARKAAVEAKQSRAMADA